MKNRIKIGSALLATSTALVCAAETQVYRLVRDTETDTISIVGQDGVLRQVCLVDPAEYALLTGRVEQVWRSMNETHEGRKNLHGRVTAQKIEGTEKITTYADGYTYREKMEVRKTHTFDNTPRRANDEKPSNISERHWKMRLKKAEKQNLKTVIVEHDAATGKDKVK